MPQARDAPAAADLDVSEKLEVQRSNSSRQMSTTMNKTSEDSHVQIVLNAFDTLFNKRDYDAAEQFWSPRYLHTARISRPVATSVGLVKTMPATLRYENHLAAATGDFVILHGRFSGMVCQRRGSSPTSFAWRTGCSQSTGTSSR